MDAAGDSHLPHEPNNDQEPQAGPAAPSWLEMAQLLGLPPPHSSQPQILALGLPRGPSWTEQMPPTSKSMLGRAFPELGLRLLVDP